MPAKPGPSKVFERPQDARAYLLAGRSTVTAKSLKTGDHYTFKVTRSERGDVFFVKVLVGGDEHFEYAGILRSAKAQRLTLTFASKVNESSPCVKAFDYVMRALGGLTFPAELELRHEGVCGRCGRPLTHPDSIDRGIGPECAKKFACEAA